jgi:hypothetical protein
MALRYPGHDAARWYPVRELNPEAEDPVSPPDYVWLDMGILRGVRREDLQIRRDLRRRRSSARGFG